MQLKATCFYFTMLLSLVIANSVCASPVDTVKRDRETMDHDDDDGPQSMFDHGEHDSKNDVSEFG